MMHTSRDCARYESYLTCSGTQSSVIDPTLFWGSPYRNIVWCYSNILTPQAPLGMAHRCVGRSPNLSLKISSAIRAVVWFEPGCSAEGLTRKEIRELGGAYKRRGMIAILWRPVTLSDASCPKLPQYLPAHCPKTATSPAPSCPSRNSRAERPRTTSSHYRRRDQRVSAFTCNT